LEYLLLRIQRKIYLTPYGASIKRVKDNLICLLDGVENISAGYGYEEAYILEFGLASIGSSDDYFNLLMGTITAQYKPS
jgi:hypothetical protein